MTAQSLLYKTFCISSTRLYVKKYPQNSIKIESLTKGGGKIMILVIITVIYDLSVSKLLLNGGVIINYLNGGIG